MPASSLVACRAASISPAASMIVTAAGRRSRRSSCPCVSRVRVGCHARPCPPRLGTAAAGTIPAVSARPTLLTGDSWPRPQGCRAAGVSRPAGSERGPRQAGRSFRWVLTDERHLVESLSPGTAQAHQVRAVDPAIAEIGPAQPRQCVEPGPESARPLAGPAELASLVTRGDRAAVEHARRTWRCVAFYHCEHRLVEAIQTLLEAARLDQRPPPHRGGESDQVGLTSSRRRVSGACQELGRSGRRVS
jgi:hypothetical protein